MANIVVQFTEKTQNRNLNPPATGSNVAAWAVSKFVQTPADGTYPTTQSPDATGTTNSSGAVTLSGLTSSALYYVSIVDEAGMPHWTQPVVAGSGVTQPLVYVPAPYTPPAPIVYNPLCRAYLIDDTPLTGGSLVPVPFDGANQENGTLTLNLDDNSIDPTEAGYYHVTIHLTFICPGAGKFTSGDLLTVSFYVGSTLRSSTTVAPPTGATTFTVELNDTYITGSYTARASLTTSAGTTVDVEGGAGVSYLLVYGVAIP
jgi:hypothetical protein